MARAPRTPAEPATPPAAAFDFEQSMAELETVVGRLEQGDVPLEEALATFERGIGLTRACQDALTAAEQKVELLLARPDGSQEPVPFHGTEADE